MEGGDGALDCLVCVISSKFVDLLLKEIRCLRLLGSCVCREVGEMVARGIDLEDLGSLLFVDGRNDADCC